MKFYSKYLHFHSWKCIWNRVCRMLAILFSGLVLLTHLPLDKMVGIGSGNGLVPNRQQAMTWTDVTPVHQHIYAALGGDELTHWTWHNLEWVLLVVSKPFSRVMRCTETGNLAVWCNSSTDTVTAMIVIVYIPYCSLMTWQTSTVLMALWFPMIPCVCDTIRVWPLSKSALHWKIPMTVSCPSHWPDYDICRNL